METRIAVVSIIVENPEVVSELNNLLHEFSEYVIGRMGIPYREKGINIIHFESEFALSRKAVNA